MITSGRMAAALLAVAALTAGCATAPPRTDEARRMAAQEAIEQWSQHSRTAAMALIDEYGPPDRIEAGRLTWIDKHLFKKIAVWDQIPGQTGPESEDVVEQTVAYDVPAGKVPELDRFSDRVTVSSDGRELSARCDSTEAAVLALNLANEVVLGIKTPDEARASYDRTLRLRAAGKSSPFMEGLIFLPAR